MKELAARIERLVERLAMQQGKFSGEKVTVRLELTNTEKEEFLKMDLNDYVHFEFEGNTLYFTTEIGVNMNKLDARMELRMNSKLKDDLEKMSNEIGITSSQLVRDKIKQMVTHYQISKSELLETYKYR